MRHLPRAVFVFLASFGLMRPAVAAQNSTWEPVGLSGGGGMFAPAISSADPDLMMLNCDMSAAYISENGGHSWRMIHHSQLRSDTGCRPAFHPQTPDIIYASSGGRLKVSRDRGHTFFLLGNIPESLQGEIAIDPADPLRMIAGTRAGNCWISANGGTNWDKCAGPTGRAISFHFARKQDLKFIFAATDKGIWRSTDGGLTWVVRTEGLPWPDIQGFSGGTNPKANQAILYCTIKSKNQNGAFQGGVFRSEDFGNSWHSAMGQGLNIETTAADQYSYAPIAQYVQIFTTDVRPTTVYVMNTATGFSPPHFDTVYRSDDSGEHWRPTYFMDPRFTDYNVGPDFFTASTGQSWKGGETPFGAAICDSDPERLILVRNECHVTHEGGTNWFCGSTQAVPGEKPKPGSAWVCNGLVVTTTWHHYVDPFQPNRHYICYTDLGWARSLDAGKTWIWWDPKTWSPWRNTCYELAFDPEVPGMIWGAFSDVHDIPNDNIISGRHSTKYPGGVCLSTDFGASWKPSSEGLPRKPVTSICIDPASPKGARVLFAAVFEAGVYKSTDDGKTWKEASKGLGSPANMRVYRVARHSDGTLHAIICAKRPGPRQSLMTEGVGLYRSSDGAKSWEKINASQPLLYPKDFCVDPGDGKRILIGAADPNGEDKQGGLYLTEDAGKTWKRIGREGPQTFGGYFHPKHKDWLYMTLTEDAPGAGLWLSQDRGQTWQPFKQLPFANIQRVELDPVNESCIYVTTFGGSVWHGPATPAQEAP